jgi:hypothetical protein
MTTKYLFALFTIAAVLIATRVSAQNATVVFVGIPVQKVSEAGLSRVPEKARQRCPGAPPQAPTNGIVKLLTFFPAHDIITPAMPLLCSLVPQIGADLTRPPMPTGTRVTVFPVKSSVTGSGSTTASP